MASYSILTRKQNLLAWIEGLHDQQVLKKLENVKEEAEEKSGSYLIAGKPMTVNELKERAMSAHEAALNGEFITHEDLKKDMDKW